MPTIIDDLLEIIAWGRSLFEDAEDAVTGSITESVNAILDVKEFDCGGNWVVYVQTAGIALGHALYLLLTPSPGEILENYLEPKPGRRSGRRGRRKGRNRRPVSPGGFRLFFDPPIPDIDEQIASFLPGREHFKGRRIGATEFVFWTSINVADRVLWHWLLIEATRTFATKWQSGLMESGECINEGPGYAKVSTIDLPLQNFFPSWAGFGELSTNISSNMEVGSQGGIATPSSNLLASGFLVVTMTVTGEAPTPLLGGSQQVGFSIFVTDPIHGNYALLTAGETLTVTKGSKGSVTVSAQAPFEAVRNLGFSNRSAALPGGGVANLRYTMDIAVHVEGFVNV